eukprot:TRINITY_DN39652_c0_g1_i1.p1 TRINITY_DN39652_c0_g1~~TRINITY_DN39652_c0_g1_i1.p1  ORF type:complete len:510 (-),score=100.50 TRINITY_DN39652_c0_g1_i1:72-1601(-)
MVLLLCAPPSSDLVAAETSMSSSAPPALDHRPQARASAGRSRPADAQLGRRCGQEQDDRRPRRWRRRSGREATALTSRNSRRTGAVAADLATVGSARLCGIATLAADLAPREEGILRVHSINGDEIACVHISLDRSVFALKLKLRASAATSPYRQELLLATRILPDESCLRDLGVGPRETLTLVKRSQPLALTCTFDRACRLWDLQRRTCIESVCDPEYAPLAAAADLDCMRALVAYNGGMLGMTSLATGAFYELGQHGTGICCMVVGWQARMALTGSNDASVAVWTLNASSCGGQRRSTLLGHRGVVFAVAAVWGECARAVSGAADGSIRIWDIAREACVQIFDNAHVGAVLALDVGSDAADDILCRFVSGGEGDGLVKVWDLRADDAGAVVGVSSTLGRHDSAVSAVACSFARDRVLSGGGDGSLRLWNTSGSLIAVLPGHASIVWSLSARWAEGLACSVSHDGFLRLWRLEPTISDDLGGGDDAATKATCVEQLHVGTVCKHVLLV